MATQEKMAMELKSTAPLCIRLDVEAMRLLREQVPSRFGLGRFIGRLIFEHVTRVEEKKQAADAYSEILKIHGLAAKEEAQGR